MKTSEKRTYRMGARAESAQATADRILDATVAAFLERPSERIPLDEVARRAGVSRQTVIRHFGNREGLLAAATLRSLEQVREERGGVEPGDVSEGVRVLVDHYERTGDGAIRMLAEELGNPAIRGYVDVGRRYHESWCEEVFAPYLEELSPGARERRLSQLVAMTDVYVWKLLRRDRGLSRKETEESIREAIESMIGV